MPNIWYNNSNRVRTDKYDTNTGDETMQKRFLAALLAAFMTAAAVLCNITPLRAQALLFTPNATVQSEAAVLLSWCALTI